MKKIIAISFLVFVSTLYTYAQINLDSLISSIDLCESEDRAKVIMKAKVVLGNISRENAIDQLQDWKLGSAEKNLSTTSLYGYHTLLASQFILIDDYVSYINYQKLAALYASESNSKQDYASSLNLITHGYNLNSQVDSALYYSNLAIEYAKQNLEPRGLRGPLVTRAGIHKATKDFESAKQYLLEAYNLDETDDGFGNRQYIIYELLSLFYEINDMESYAAYTEVLAENLNLKGRSTPFNHFPIRELILSDNSDESIQRLFEVIEIAEKSKTRLNQTYFFTAMTLFEKMEGRADRFEKLLPIFLSLEKNLLESETPFWLSAVYERLSLLFETEEKYDEALEYQKLKEKELYSAKIVELNGKIAELEVKYDTKNKEEEILSQELIIHKQKQNRSTLLTVISIMLLISLILWKMLRDRIKYQKAINIKNQEIHQVKLSELERNKDLEIVSALMKGEEKERKRIAQDLHDSLGGMMTNIKLHINLVDKEFQNPTSKKINHLIDDACSELRRISSNMTPSSIFMAGLSGAIEDLVYKMSTVDIDISYEDFGEICELSEAITINVYRIIQELLSNAVKHAKAKKIMVQLIKGEDELTAIVEDDGVGFDINNVRKNGMGLTNLKSRVDFLAGELSIDSKKGNGSSFLINIPLKQLNNNDKSPFNR